MNKYFKSKKLTPAQQHQRMLLLHPQFRHKSFKQNRIVWIGDIKPSPLSEIYTVQITYQTNKAPTIAVLSPKLQLIEGAEKLPHVYVGDYLCLYYPLSSEWSSVKFIADTIVPWISLWLFYYEGWLATDEWHGGGIEHGNRTKKQS